MSGLRFPPENAIFGRPSFAAQYPSLLAVVTADHGDLLGEYGGKYGHEGNFAPCDELPTASKLER